MKHFHYFTDMATLQHNNPCPGGHEIYNFNRPYLGHHYYILSLFDLCLGVEKICKEIMHFHFMNYMDTPQHKNPCPGGHEIYNFVSLVIMTMPPKQRRIFSMKYINITLFTPMITSPGGGGGGFLTLQMLHAKFSKDCLSSS